jgi:hypothetical protein
MTVGRARLLAQTVALITPDSIRVAGCRDFRPVVDGANRIGHRRRPVLRRVPSSGTRSGIAVQEGLLPSLCGSTNGPVESPPSCGHPVDRTCRNVPFLTGQKGDEKSRTARGPVKESAEEEESRQAVPLLSVLRRKEHRSGENLYPRVALPPALLTVSPDGCGSPTAIYNGHFAIFNVLCPPIACRKSGRRRRRVRGG